MSNVYAAAAARTAKWIGIGAALWGSIFGLHLALRAIGLTASQADLTFFGIWFLALVGFMFKSNLSDIQRENRWKAQDESRLTNR